MYKDFNLIFKIRSSIQFTKMALKIESCDYVHKTRGRFMFYSKMIVLVQSSFHTTWASLIFEMELEPNSLDWNGNQLEHKLELEDMKHTLVSCLNPIPTRLGHVTLI